MRLKEIEAIPVGKIRKKGKIVRHVKSEKLCNLLILDIFVDKEYMGRYVQDVTTGEYAAKRKDTWHNVKFESLAGESIGEYYYIPEMKGWKFEDDKQAADVGEMYGLHSAVTVSKITDYIRQKEYGYGRDKRDRAYESKRERIGKLMESVPDVPYTFREWWLSVCRHPANFEYAFWDKERDDYRCTACGKTHVIAGAKHRREYICERTGKAIVAIRRQQEISFTDYAMILSDVNEDWVAERLLKVETTFCDGKKTVYPKETIRVMLSRKGKKTKIYYNQYFENLYGGYNGEWWDTNSANKKWSSAYMYPVVADLSGTCCAGLKVKEMAAVGEKLNWNGLLYYADHMGCFEYLLKMGLTRLAREESEKLDVWNGYRNRLDGIHTEINVFGENAEEIMGINMQRIHRLRSVKGGRLILRWMKMEESSGKKVSKEALELAELKDIEAEHYTFLMNRMSPEQIINYVAKMRREHPEKYRNDSQLSADWKDYLAMAVRLGMDVTDPIVFKPKDLKQRHDQCIEEIRKLGDDEWICEIHAKYPEIDSICLSIQDKYAYANERFTMIVPKGIRDIVEDGRQLHHCSASSERYFERINRKECFLLFLRKNEDLSKAWYTVEIQPDGTVRQKRTEYNRQDDIEEVMRFLKEWQRAIKKRLTQEDVELGNQSSIQREIEQMELLQKGDTKSMQVWQELENDYLKNEETTQVAI